MKRLLIILLAFIFSVGIYTDTQAQQVAKNYVVVEIGTGTWCGYCPGAAMGADDMVENGLQVAILENHNGDSYANTSSSARNSYYGITGYPTAFFNGGYSVVGGSSSQSMYSNYLPKYNQAIAVMSDFTMELSYTHTGLDYTATIDVDEVGNYSGTNLVVQLAWTQSYIEESWQGLDELNFVNRGMFPNASGTPYTGGTQSFNINFTAEYSWDPLDSELIAFIQDNDTKEILQAAKVSLAEINYANNMGFSEVAEFTDGCANPVTPHVKVRNRGSSDITSFTIDYSVNGGAETGSYSWSGGSFAPGEYFEFDMEPISFTEELENTLSLNIASVNGVADEDTFYNNVNNILISRLADYSPVVVEIMTDNYGSETSWTLENSGGDVIASGSGYGNNTLYTTNAYIYPNECYTFTINDAWGDGMCCTYGEGYYQVKSGSTIILEGGEFGTVEVKSFKTTDNVTGVNDNDFENVEIFPNPTTDHLFVKNAEGLDMEVFDMQGRVLMQKENLSQEESISTENYVPGTYFVRLTNGFSSHVEKLIVK